LSEVWLLNFLRSYWIILGLVSNLVGKNKKKMQLKMGKMMVNPWGPVGFWIILRPAPSSPSWSARFGGGHLERSVAQPRPPLVPERLLSLLHIPTWRATKGNRSFYSVRQRQL
jgi:hypothetical protein